MLFVQDNSPGAFLQNATDLLSKDPAFNNLMLGLASAQDGLAPSDRFQGALYLRVENSAGTMLAGFKANLYLILSRSSRPEAVELLVDRLFEFGAVLPGVTGPPQEVESFSRRWINKTKQMSRVSMCSGIYKITRVIVPTVTGKVRLASQKDLSFLPDWLLGFAKESLPEREWLSTSEYRSLLEASVSKGWAYLLEDQGFAVSLVQVSRPTDLGISINSVFTPVKFRKKGYASYLVARVSQEMLSQGKLFCTLYADSSNPTSVKIYKSIGYHHIGDWQTNIFD